MNSRQKLQFALLIFLVFCALVAHSGYWVYWCFAAVMSSFMLIFDFLFLDENDFLYEPNYKHWEKLNDPKRTLRAIHYSKDNWAKTSPLKSHSDMRDLHDRYVQLTQTNTDFRELKLLIVRHARLAVYTWMPLVAGLVWAVRDAKKKKRQFEVHYLNQLPQKEYEEQDYQYKFWEFALPKTHEKYGDVVSSDNTKSKFVLMYHSEIKNANHLAMQRFSRLKKFMLLRKIIDVECVFVALDEELDPQLLLEYAKTYGDDILPCWGGDGEAQAQLAKTFLNLGCVYLFERDTGNVIYITDPAKYPLESLANKLIYVIGKFEDLQRSKEWSEKGVDFRLGQEEKLMIRRPTY